MDRPVRVLHVITELGSGGAESFLMNMCQHMDPQIVQFDFLLRNKRNIYSDKLADMGCKVYYTASFPRHWFRNFVQTRKIIKQNHYDVVHVHANALLYVVPLLCAKQFNVPCRIMHSHNSAMAFMKFLPIHQFFKIQIGRYATHCFACSDQAGEWMFGKKLPYTVIHNAVDLQKFRYDQTARASIRREYGIPDDAFVVGHVGRFWEQKNHSFLLDVFASVLLQRPNAFLILLGEGGLKEKMEDKARSMGIYEHVVFAGFRKDVPRALSAFDVFAFPSIYEGLSVVAIEAQANGLPLICSEATPTSVLFSEHSKQIPLSSGVDIWSESILAAEGNRYDAHEKIRKAGYDIREEAKKLQDFYCLQKRLLFYICQEK